VLRRIARQLRMGHEPLGSGTTGSSWPRFDVEQRQVTRLSVGKDTSVLGNVDGEYLAI